MYNTGKILDRRTEPPITMEYILSKISEYDIFAKYVGEFKIGRIYHSPLREDPDPSFGIYVSSKTGSLLYKDLGNGDCGNVFKFVKRIKNLSTYKETYLEIIKDLNVNTTERKLTHTNYTKTKETILSVVRKQFNATDIKFWNRFGISKETLEIYKVNAISKYLSNGIVKGEYSQEDPMFCYRVFNKFKIYRPFSTKINKWRSSLSNLDIQGFEQLPEKGDLLIITKSLKDVMVLYEMGYNAVAPASESAAIPEIVMSNLKRRFKKILIFYDRDRAGIIFARRETQTHNLNAIFINKKYKKKDISDFVEHYGYSPGLEMLDWLIS
jgi:DNA primase